MYSCQPGDASLIVAALNEEETKEWIRLPSLIILFSKYECNFLLDINIILMIIKYNFLKIKWTHWWRLSSGFKLEPWTNSLLVNTSSSDSDHTDVICRISVAFVCIISKLLNTSTEINECACSI